MNICKHVADGLGRMLIGIFKLCQNQKAILKVIPMGIAYNDNISCIFMVPYSFTNAFTNVLLTRKNVDLHKYEISSIRRSTLREQHSFFVLFILQSPQGDPERKTGIHFIIIA